VDAVPKHLLRQAPEQYPADAAAAAGGHGDEVSVRSVRVLQDLLRRIANHTAHSTVTLPKVVAIRCR
jgi:hypothetical protein